MNPPPDSQSPNLPILQTSKLSHRHFIDPFISKNDGRPPHTHTHTHTRIRTAPPHQIRCRRIDLPIGKSTNLLINPERKIPTCQFTPINPTLLPTILPVYRPTSLLPNNLPTSRLIDLAIYPYSAPQSFNISDYQSDIPPHHCIDLPTN